MAKRRMAALGWLREIRWRLNSGRLRHLDEEWLSAAIDRAIDGDPDPFGVRPGRGARPDPAIQERNLDIAKDVHWLITREGKSLFDACEDVGEARNLSGANGGTVENAYLEHRQVITQMFAVPDAIHRAMVEGRDPLSDPVFLKSLFTEHVPDPD